MHCRKCLEKALFGAFFCSNQKKNRTFDFVVIGSLVRFHKAKRLKECTPFRICNKKYMHFFLHISKLNRTFAAAIGSLSLFA